jgi:hypothetical protein
MEWCIPLQKLEVGKVQMGTLLPGPKPLVPLSYLDGQVHFPSLSILLPHCTVKFYDPRIGRLDISSQGLQKLQALQKTLLQAVSLQQQKWFGQEYRDMAELQQLFQPMIEEDILHLYCPVQPNGISDSIVVYQGDEKHMGVRASDMKPGDSIRVALRIQGISFHSHPTYGLWTGKFRFQHRIIALYVVPSS